MRQGKIGERYNIGGGNERPNLAIVEGICEMLERISPPTQPYGVLTKFVQDRPGDDRRYAIDASKIRRELRWKPRHSFESGLESTVRWYHDNRPWCAHVQSGNYDRERLGKI